MQQSNYDVIIIGAGAAGLMCAQLAAARGQKILLLDHSTKLAEKIRISGGGRCNFTNLNASPENYISHNKHFAASALARYTPHHFCELLDWYNIGYHEKTLGQLFCDQKSQAIIDLLDHLGTENNVTRKMGTSVSSIEHSNAGFKVNTTQGNFTSDKLVIATGGLAIPQIGATGFGYQIAQQFSINVLPTFPALVPLTIAPQDLPHFQELAGISFFGETLVNNAKFQEMCLFTHRGMSGPAILQISSYWNPGDKITLDLLPIQKIKDIIANQRQSNKLLSNFFSNFFSQKFANYLCKLLGFDRQLSQLSNAQISAIEHLIHSFQICPSGSEGYKKAEVTRGGVDTAELNQKTMMSRKIDGLYFIGEVVDVTGWLGGYNFQWAWSSAYAAATSF